MQHPEQQQPQQPQPTYQTVGFLSAIDNKRNYKPLRVSLTEESGQVRWYSAFEGVGRALEAGGQGSGPWTITYVERPYTSAAGTTGINLNVRQAVLGGQAPQPQPQQQPQVQQQPQQQVQPQQTPPAQHAPDGATWSLGMDDRGRAIIRQVAFKAAADVAGVNWSNAFEHVERIADMTDVFEEIILGSYVPPHDAAGPEPPPTAPPAEDDFIQESF